MEWQPIETAPDGEDVLLCVPRYGVGFPEMAVGQLVNGKWYSDSADEEKEEYLLNTPTHWMPLPEPPLGFQEYADAQHHKRETALRTGKD